MILTDSHCHLAMVDAEAESALLERARAAGVRGFVVPGTTAADSAAASFSTAALATGSAAGAGTGAAGAGAGAGTFLAAIGGRPLSKAGWKICTYT